MGHQRKRHGGRRSNCGTRSWLKRSPRLRYGTEDNRRAHLEPEAWIKSGALVVARENEKAVWCIANVTAYHRTRGVRLVLCANMRETRAVTLRRFYQQFRRADTCMYAEFGCTRVDMAEHPRGGKHYYCNAHAPFGSVGVSTFMGVHGGCWGGECPNWESPRHPDCDGPIPSACMYDSMCGNCFGHARYSAGDGRSAALVGGEKDHWRICPIKPCPGTLQFQSNIGHRLNLECDQCAAHVTQNFLPVKAYGIYEMTEEEVCTADGRPYPPAPQIYALGQRVVIRLDDFGAPAFRFAFHGQAGVVEKFEAYCIDPMSRFTGGPAYWVRLNTTPNSWPRNPLWIHEKELAAEATQTAAGRG